MKKFIIVLTVCLLCALAVCGFSACADKSEGGEISVVCTVFPIYDWTRNIVGDQNVDVKLLLDSGADLHSYNPTVKDMYDISQCDLFIYVGGESDEWVEKVLTSYPSEKRIALNLMEVLGDRVREEEEGVEAEEEEKEEEGEEETEYDEHIWLSVKNASFCSEKIAEKLAAVDGDHADVYANNLTSYKASLTSLDNKFTEAVSTASVKTLVFADRFPFLYLLKDYGLSYFAAFKGCSTEVNASFPTIKFLADKIDELNLKNVFVIESSDKKIAQSVIRETANRNQTILVLDSLQSVTKTEINNGTTYLSVMEGNMNVLRNAIR